MIDTRLFIHALTERNVSLFAGVPDSLLKEFSGCLMQMGESVRHIITANEGNAVGLAIGHYLATGTPGLVYMQNSGLGNVVNPVASLADPDVYAVPMLLLIGWRGEPGIKDEPQHKKQGKITLSQLDVLGIPYRILDASSDVDSTLDEIWECMNRRSGPVALVVRKGTLSPVGYSPAKEPLNWPSGLAPLYRELAIKTILENLPEEACVIATTGKTGREVFEIRSGTGQPQRDFLTVGGMGHASSIALGIALEQPSRPVVCLDGDGALLMHMGAVAISGNLHCSNFIHVVLNNQAHESVGGQPTVAGNVEFDKISIACGYETYSSVRTLEELQSALFTILNKKGPHFLEIHLWKGSRDDLGRPTRTPIQNKESVMEFLKNYKF